MKFNVVLINKHFLMYDLLLDLGGNFKKGACEHVERRNAPYLLLNFCCHWCPLQEIWGRLR